ncbi:hypothetical protein I5907_19415 [Panacibacter sp. DH6]|uniref:Uncharacterized protein n=1 Tax=Panacibacter microcysteis TaxID=2793269 RepID=A0A931GZU1_9BACT|nr:hypothetical protein [Panacibacter microcysteis]MBG9378416.1 hypothetical protein [Panacibacter microcysteis]
MDTFISSCWHYSNVSSFRPTQPERTAIKETTVREFTQHTLALNYSTLVANEGTNRQEMESVINHIIADMAGLDLEEVTSEKKIADDLGID